MKRAVIVILALAVFPSCAAFHRRAAPATNAALRQSPEGAEVFVFDVNRKDIKAMLASSGSNKGIRLIQTFGREESPSASTNPEYRVFDIQPGSAYETLGLRNNDVLISANHFSVLAPKNFPLFVKKLSDEPGGEFELRRAGEPLILRFKFLD